MHHRQLVITATGAGWDLACYWIGPRGAALMSSARFDRAFPLALVDRYQATFPGAPIHVRAAAWDVAQAAADPVHPMIGGEV